MEIYLPIAEMSVNLFLLLGLGGLIGFLSGVFGVGGGFLMTPLLIFIGIPPAVAVGSEASQILASSFSGMLAHFRRGNVDIKMGWVLVAGGALGSGLGVLAFRGLRAIGQVDVFISLAYVLFLGIIGALMFIESLGAWLRWRKTRGGGPGGRGKLHRHYWIHGLPLKVRFHRSRLYISALMPAAIGFVVGMLAALMGVGGGFIMVPAMIYLLGMPTSVVVGTSLFQISVVTAVTTFLHAVNNQTVDVVLALLLIVGGVIGAQLGSRAGARLRGDQLRFLLAAIVLLVCGRLAYDLIAEPADPYSLGAVRPS
ncbi:MAG TPA: sulfite exporter TauE/SafE family protein [Geminicoccaceae bacterium]|nr:sulfite exporter TauE/SafE family protein [Geminicoccaceae bacterium]